MENRAFDYAALKGRRNGGTAERARFLHQLYEGPQAVVDPSRCECGWTRPRKGTTGLWPSRAANRVFGGVMMRCECGIALMQREPVARVRSRQTYVIMRLQAKLSSTHAAW